MDYTELITLVAAQLGENPTTPIRWSTTEFEFAANEALKKISGYFGDWVKETTLNLTDVTDTYDLPGDLVRVTRWSYTDDSHVYYVTDRGSLPTDGREGQPEWAAFERSSASTPGSRAMVFYPYPDNDYDVIVTYQYLPTVDKDSPSTVIPIGIDLEYPLVMLTCHYLSSKSTVEKNQFDQENYYMLAMKSLTTTVALDVNDEYKGRKGYF